MPVAAVEVDDVSKRFSSGNVLALDHVSLTVEQGAVFGLLGPNGAGKTTLVRILSTVLAPDSGTARVLGFDVRREGDRIRRSIGLAGQYATVDENLTGSENLRMVGRLCRLSRAAARARATELLETFGLDDAAHRPVKTYSGGMRRRLDLAASLVVRPPLLFLDEPTTGLDPQSRKDLWAVIEELVAGGATILLTTQYLEEADRFCQRLCVIDHGRIIEAGTPSELKSRLGATVLVVTFASLPDAQHARDLLADLTTHDAVLDGAALELPVANGPQATAEALRRLDAAALEVRGIVLREPSLDDVFLTLTGRRTEDEPALAGGARR